MSCCLEHIYIVAASASLLCMLHASFWRTMLWSVVRKARVVTSVQSEVFLLYEHQVSTYMPRNV